MKRKQYIRVTVLLSFLVLVTRGKGISYKKHRQVNKTIQLKGGDVYGCIDIKAQPSFSHPRLKDHKIQMQPSSFPIGLDIGHVFPHAVLEAQPSLIDCPVGTVPILRNNRSGTTEARNIDALGSIEREVAGIKLNGDVFGLSAAMTVNEPKVNKDSKDFSASWVQINNGGGEHTDRIGVGLEVNPSLSGDTHVRFHIGWTDGLYKRSCIDLGCPGFVQVNPKFPIGAKLSNVSVYDGPQYEMRVRIFKDPKSKNWWLTYGRKNIPIGYWPNGLFTFMNYKGDFAFWGGIVQGPTATSKAPQMGSGHFASEGFLKAAYMKSMEILDENNKYITPEDNSRVTHGTSNYALYTVNDFRFGEHGMSMFYGGPGVVV
ncbi:unnamed protein product [Alopecurus aequalis]